MDFGFVIAQLSPFAVISRGGDCGQERSAEVRRQERSRHNSESNAKGVGGSEARLIVAAAFYKVQ